MDDAEWLFKQDSKEKKDIARSARKKKRHTGCKLPTDYRSKKEIKELNGEVRIMNTRKPMTWTYFKLMPLDIQAEYIAWLNKRFKAKSEDIARKFHISKSTFSKYLSEKKVPVILSHNRYAVLKEQEWEAFWNNEPIKEDEAVEEPAVEAETAPQGADIHSAPAVETVDRVDESETKPYILDLSDVSDQAGICIEEPRTIEEVATETPFELQTLNLTLRDIRDWESLQRALSAFSLPLHNSVTISIHAIKEE